ncbi:MAG: helix-turn-helix domain-containing protein [Candidatus Acidiferrales bacterium]
MNALTEQARNAPFPVVNEGGRPVAVIVPIEEFARHWPERQATDLIPHAVARRVLKEGITPIQAWREHLGLTQTEVAERMGVSQPTYSVMETSAAPRRATRERIAKALGIAVAQLT